MRNHYLFPLLALAALLAGCNAGMAPSGMDENDAKAAIDQMKPEDKIRFIASSPLPAADKQRKYDEIEKETGVKAADVLGGAGGAMPGSGN